MTLAMALSFTALYAQAKPVQHPATVKHTTPAKHHTYGFKHGFKEMGNGAWDATSATGHYVARKTRAVGRAFKS
jgi:hypothetical protein